MTPENLAELLRLCPTLYHMAERGSWPSIRERGLLSTSALLDLFEITGPERHAIESARRPDSVVIEHPRHGRAVIRDQKPMDDAGLRRCLPPDLAPEDWYRLLNERVFLWLTPERLHRLLAARPYRDQEHDVLELDAASLIAAYRDRITLSPINSGATKPFPAKRGPNTFHPIETYPYAATRRPRRDRVVELAVTGGIPDAHRFVCRVRVMRGDQTLATLHTA